MVITWMTKQQVKQYTETDDILLKAHLNLRGVDTNKKVMQRYDEQRGLFYFWNPEEKKDETSYALPAPVDGMSPKDEG